MQNKKITKEKGEENKKLYFYGHYCYERRMFDNFYQALNFAEGIYSVEIFIGPRGLDPRKYHSKKCENFDGWMEEVLDTIDPEKDMEFIGYFDDFHGMLEDIFLSSYLLYSSRKGKKIKKPKRILKGFRFIPDKEGNNFGYIALEGDKGIDIPHYKIGYDKTDALLKREGEEYQDISDREHCSYNLLGAMQLRKEKRLERERKQRMKKNKRKRKKLKEMKQNNTILPRRLKGKEIRLLKEKNIPLKKIKINERIFFENSFFNDGNILHNGILLLKLGLKEKGLLDKLCSISKIKKFISSYGRKEERYIPSIKKTIEDGKRLLEITTKNNKKLYYLIKE